MAPFFLGDVKTRDLFAKELREILTTAEGRDILSYLGVEIEEIGSHSCRKGAASFCTSGAVGGPGCVPTFLRAGWSLGSVKDRYFHLEGAGDQFVGRTVCGLDADSRIFLWISFSKASSQCFLRL